MTIEQHVVERDLVVSGRPASTHLGDVRTMSRQVVRHFVSTVATCGTLPGEAISGDVTTVTRVCLELAARMLDGDSSPEKSDRLRAAAGEWAREGIPIDTIHHAVHEGLKMAFDRISAQATARDYHSMVDIARRFLDIVDSITSTVALAYVRELRSVVNEHHTAVHTLTSALLGGHSTSTMARECGIAVADSYHVLALAVPPHRDESDPALDSAVVARRKLRRVQAELARRCGGHALALLSVDGGTVLIPEEHFDPERGDEFVEQLSAAAQVPIRATLVHSATDDIPASSDRAHELLDIVQRLDLVGGLYRFGDLALEYQLTRPGPARATLGAVLDPLDDNPELLETLRVHISNNLNRQRTARVLYVHANTIDHRFKRIGQLTGFDPGQVKGLWYLRSALVARSYRAGAGGEPARTR
ncbi:helix-turn-helix domain-containing protein [Nocardia sp. NPDC050697]|uniref:PucR family transcriptional regulator n=1 Tax=Nocardia sp. NPDC050697 TaxID=3155158 RepID=UPI0033C11859